MKVTKGMKRGKHDSTDGNTKKKMKTSKHMKPHAPPKGKGKKKRASKYEKSTKKPKSDASNKPKSPKPSETKKPNANGPTDKVSPTSEPKSPKTVKKNTFKAGKPNQDRIKYCKKEPNENTTNEKPDWLKYKKEQKELRDKRRAKKLEDTYEVAVKVKQIGEKLRRTNLSPEMQAKLTKKMHDLSENHYAKLIFSHDLSRVIQWQVKYCSPDIQLAIAAELKPHLRSMFTSKYAKNVVKTLLKKGSDSVKRCILETCTGKVVKLVSNVISAPIFEKLYVEVATDTEKYLFKQEFYGDIYKQSKDPNVKTLEDVYKNSQDMKTATLSALKANLTKILNKNLINSTLVHTLLYEYLSNCSKEDRAEIIVMVRPLIAELSQSKYGAKAGNLCIWHGTNKDRKLIMKALKEHIKDIMTSEHGHLMILALLDSVDDTVLLKKILLQEVLKNLNEIVLDEHGRRVILYIVARRDTRYFHPSLVSYLAKGDGNACTKKPADIREKELLEAVIDNILESIASDVKTWLLSNGPTQLATLAVFKASSGDKPRLAFQAIASFIADPEAKIKKDEKTFEAIEEAGMHMVLKKLIQLDKQRVERGELTFGEVLLEHLTVEVIEHWINSNRGCFVLVLLMNNEAENIVSELTSRLRKVKALRGKTSKGATILLEKLDSSDCG